MAGADIPQSDSKVLFGLAPLQGRSRRPRRVESMLQRQFQWEEMPRGSNQLESVEIGVVGSEEECKQEHQAEARATRANNSNGEKDKYEQEH